MSAQCCHASPKVVSHVTPQQLVGHRKASPRQQSTAQQGRGNFVTPVLARADVRIFPAGVPVISPAVGWVQDTMSASSVSWLWHMRM